MSSVGDEAIALAELAGLFLDPWQQMVLTDSLGERPDGKWAAQDVGLVVARQNGKGAILEARELAGLFIIGEDLIIHTAHQQKTASDQFRRLLLRIDNIPEFKRRILRTPHGNGQESIELRNGKRILFSPRTAGGGLGLSCDMLVYDEAMILPEEFVAAVAPTQAARSMASRTGVQTWYTGSAVDQMRPRVSGIPFARIREQGIKGDDPGLAYFEWSIDGGDDPDRVPPEVLRDPKMWAQANPGLGVRISPEYVERELGKLGHRGFATERLSVGDWPRTDAEPDRFIDLEAWEACADPGSTPTDQVAYAFDIMPDRAWATICKAAMRSDGNYHIEIVAHDRNTGWIVDKVQELLGESPIYCDNFGAARSLVSEFERRRIPTVCLAAKDVTEACGLFYDSIVDSGSLRHLDEEAMNTAVEGAATRPLGGAWAWSRKNPAIDITPLVAATVALWGLRSGGTAAPQVFDLNEVWAEMQERKRKEEEDQ